MAHFGLEPYEPRFRVSVIVSGTFDIDADGEDEARRRVRYLIDGIAHSGDEDSDSLEVSLDDIAISEAEAL